MHTHMYARVRAECTIYGNADAHRCRFIDYRLAELSCYARNCDEMMLMVMVMVIVMVKVMIMMAMVMVSTKFRRVVMFGQAGW